MNLACGLAHAAAGKGENGRKREDKEKSNLRQQALKALGEAKDLGTKHLDNAANRSKAREVLQQLRSDTDLASLRDPQFLKNLPPDEQKAFTQYWAEVDALIKQLSSAPSREIKP